jgi:exopolysaccharide biosynthesis polyprenyl glycosylphosphotransferase
MTAPLDSRSGKIGGPLDTVTLPVGKSSSTEMLSEAAFLRMLALERKRSERSHRRFVLMLLHVVKIQAYARSGATAQGILDALCESTRETDIKGWYDKSVTIGVIFTEIGDAAKKTVVQALSNKVRKALRDYLGGQELADSDLSFHVYPEELETQNPTLPVDRMLYPDLKQNSPVKNCSLALKRTMDIAGSLLGLLLCSPIFFAIAFLVKLTSSGPVLFRQQRIGRYGRPFTFLKFRSMHVNNDHTIHRNYVTEFISARNKTAPAGPVTYKLTGDPRVTRIGRFLRRTSLDELPQFLNVLTGDMSLVGPRPPISYELAAYEPWHRNRILLVKPGITGLWQVAGRSRVTFDEMVRLDLRYATSGSFWLDLAILVRTPRAVITGQGAY